MVYEFYCQMCDYIYDVSKTIDNRNNPELCPKCKGDAHRKFLPTRLYLNHTKVTHAEYNPGLGMVVNNKQHKDRLLKERNMVEVGNDFKDGLKMSNEFTKGRDEKREKGWNDL